SSSGTKDGDVSIIGAGDITLTGGRSTSGSGATATIGHAVNDSNGGAHTGNILIQDVGNVVLVGGASSSNFAMIGLGGREVEGDHVGDITINQAGDITLLAQSNDGATAFAQIGIGLTEVSSTSSATGDIAISEVGDISLSSNGTSSNLPTQIGHGGLNSEGDLSGDISITDFGSLSLSAGTSERSYSQVGHGGQAFEGNIDGSITISATGPIDLVGVDLDQYARIGHGNHNGNSDAGFSVEGDVSVRTTSSLTLTQAEIGHQIDADGTYTSGNTFIGVGTAGGTETLTADAASRFDSAPGGELRFYIPSAASNQVAAGAFLNGTAATGPGITPNTQGEYAFGEGPYVLTDPGNFAFYTLVDAIPDFTADPFDFELIRPVEGKFDHLQTFHFPIWTGGLGTPPLLGSVAHQYETFQFVELDVSSINGLLRSSPGSTVRTGTFRSALGATVTLLSDGSFRYDPNTSVRLNQLSGDEGVYDTFAFLIYDESGELVGIGTATVLVKSGPASSSLF
ncbi:MAG: hypothetical protein P1U58_18180, partial [Verrucomicrobiales bacterium]|nr:hypothetical protein [Verrucomicrobiales bacterium]